MMFQISQMNLCELKCEYVRVFKQCQALRSHCERIPVYSNHFECAIDWTEYSEEGIFRIMIIICLDQNASS